VLNWIYNWHFCCWASTYVNAW